MTRVWEEHYPHLRGLPLRPAGGFDDEVARERGA